MNPEHADEVIQAVGGGKIKFFETDVTGTESIAAAIKGTLEWVKETGKEVGGVITAAGVGNPGKVGDISRFRVLLFLIEFLIWKISGYISFFHRRSHSIMTLVGNACDTPSGVASGTQYCFSVFFLLIL